MVDPNEISPARRAFATAGFAAALGFAFAASGCGIVSQSKVDECHRVTQTLRAENTRLKDVSLDLRTRNQDLSQRAVDDARRLSAQDEAVARLEASVGEYQAEREKLASAFESLKRQVHLSLGTDPAPSAARPGRLETFASAHPGWTYDAMTRVLSTPTDRLFEPGGDRLKPEAARELDALASELEGEGTNAEVASLGGPASQVQRAGFDPDATPGDPVPKALARFLDTSRAARVRERLVKPYGLASERVRVVPPPREEPRSSDGPEHSKEKRVEIRLSPEPSANPAVGTTENAESQALPRAPSH